MADRPHACPSHCAGKRITPDMVIERVREMIAAGGEAPKDAATP